MDSAKNQIADKLKSSNNILLTVSRDPSVDQLSALIGLTLILNKLNKHATAVFSGQTPSTIEFLQPESTLEKNTDSLRDFIISLDKTKADKLRYKVEDDVVRIFITPYKTSISEHDFEFSQGDFNVDVVVALGVKDQDDIDEAITSHGRILHDAVVTSINISEDGGLGSVNWHDSSASSLSELVTELAEVLGKDLFDNQVATALLTGIVAETERFSNEKTSSETMRASAALMSAGADQQLVAAKLSEPEKAPQPEQTEEPTSEDSDDSNPGDGTIEINHESDEEESDQEEKEPLELPEPEANEQPEQTEEPEEPEVQESTYLVEPPKSESVENEAEHSEVSSGSSLIMSPPSMGGQLTANTEPEQLEPSVDPLSMLNEEVKPLLSRGGASAVEEASVEPEQPTVEEKPAEPVQALTPPPADWMPPAPKADDAVQTLAELESSVHTQEDTAEAAREEVNRALNGLTPPPEAIQALNSQPLGQELHARDNTPPMEQPIVDADPTAVPQSKHVEEHPEIEGLQLNTDPGPAPAQPEVIDPNAPPSVPPPIPFQFGTTPQEPAQS